MIKQKSFTLIELSVVIVIIGVLAGVIMITTSSSVNNATLARAKAFSSNVQNSMLLNLVSEWTFDEGNANDSWGVNDGTVVGADPETNCVFGGCYSFNGVGDYIDCGNDSSMNTKESLTISMWVKPLRNYGLEPSVWYYFVRKNNTINPEIEFGYQGYGDVITLKMLASNDSSCSDDIDLNINKWYFFAATYDSNGTKIYRDGTLTAEDPTYLIPPQTAGTLYLGGTGTSSFNGIMDEIRLYDAALSSAQIKQNYIAGLNSMLANGSISKEEYDQRLSRLAKD